MSCSTSDLPGVVNKRLNVLCAGKLMPMWVIAEPCCQNCGLSCCLPNLCCKRNRLSIHPANSHDTVGEIVHTYPGCAK